jgi:hypothetical protein
MNRMPKQVARILLKKYRIEFKYFLNYEQITKSIITKSLFGEKYTNSIEIYYLYTNLNLKF